MNSSHNSKQRSKSATKLFEHIKIQTNNICTRRCPYCYFGQANLKREDVWLDEKVVYRLIDELKAMDFKGRVGLFETNEPLTDPRIFGFIRYAKKQLPNAFHMLITNGDLLKQRVLLRLFKSGLDKLIISIYSDAILKRVDNLKKNNLKTFKQVETLNFIDGKLFDNRGGNIKHKYASTPVNPIQAACERVHKILYVKPTGKVVTCISDFYEVNVVGDTKRSTLPDIWFGKKFKEVRRNLDNKNRQFSPLCQKCNYPGKGWFFNHVV